MFKKILAFFLTWKFLIYMSVLIFGPLIKDTVFYEAKNLFSVRYDQLIWRFANMDGIIYLRIAKNGYTQYELPFFPLYPLLIRFFASFFKYEYFTPISQIISNVAFLFTLFLIYKLTIIDGKKNLTSLLIFTLLIFPTSFFYGTSYNDSIFFLLATLTIFFIRKNKIVAASITASLATLTRLNGLTLFLLIIFEYFSIMTKFSYFNQIPLSLKKIFTYIKRAFSLKNILAKKLYFSLLIPITFLSYLAFIQNKFKNWYLLFSTMKNWGQDRITFPLQVFWRYFKILFIYPTFKLNYWIASIELLFVLFYIFILIYSFNKIRISYWVFIFFSFLIPSLTGTFQGMPRYALHLYPLFLFLAEYINQTRPFVRIIYFGISIFLLIMLLCLYTNGYFVA